ncbi:MAG: hypothetical protein U9R57_01135 [Thermodesulfobacteriota bacterium]|nr:hypothetical protein [Thermodesulfobacteriota bacterium]
MGILAVRRYPTKLFLELADHTYVECGTGKKGWACWGGKTGGTALRKAPGSSSRADKIAQPNEKAGIKCYLINGVCHQAANRILLPAGITVRGARGYSISEALFGPYGRIGFWTCKSPFKKYSSTSGDLPECVPTKKQAKAMGLFKKRSADDMADWQYIQKTLAIYREGEKQIKMKSLQLSDAMQLQVRLFQHMVDFQLGPMVDKKLNTKILKVREATEKKIEKTQDGITKVKTDMREYAEALNKITERFQDEMANLLSAEAYKALFDLKPEERIVLADPAILSKEYKVDLKY